MNSLSFLSEYANKTILITPLNWGLGHASRCVPIIKALQKNNHIIIGSDGLSLKWLKNEIQHCPFVKLPSYDITYGENSFFFHLIRQTPKITLAISQEMAIAEEIVEECGVDIILSDHRLGMHYEKCHNIILAHQIQIKSAYGILSLMAGRLNKYFINQFDECWIPDYKNRHLSLAGELSEPKGLKRYRYIGPLSRLKKKSTQIKYDVAVILSGPEPSRTRLENLLMRYLPELDLKICFVRGSSAPLNDTFKESSSISIYSISSSKEINDIFNASRMILSRSGYSTVMDLNLLNKPAIIIPTPGQTEQEYLADHLSNHDKFKVLKEEAVNLETLAKAIHQLLN